MTTVVCWDIDGTLLTTARAGVFALEEAAREVLGTVPDFASLPTAGLTDAEVAALAIRTCDAPDNVENVSAFLRVYERHLPDRLSWRQGRVLPGVVEVLDDLAAREQVACILLTGNTEAGAAAKLAHYGLAGRFEGGAFCAGVDDRETIARRAHSMALERYGPDLPADRIYVVGDTTHDVRCGKAIGARTVAVASGPVPRSELASSDPWLLLAELPEPARFAEALELVR
ncbi:MAG: haloacid dehalogenase-like hydrolase [Thermoleophilaceae bacterium]